MSIHYKFKAAKDFDTVSFDGNAISLGELKNRIIDAKGLGKALDFDLAIQNAQTNEEYTHDNSMISKNTSVIIRRVPVSRPAGQPPSKLMSSSAPLIPAQSAMPSMPKPAAMTMPSAMAPKPAAIDPNKSEADKVRDVINQSGGWHQRPMHKPFAAAGFRKYPGQNVPPPSYICYRCNQPGHYISDCPTNGDPAYDVHKVKKATGIPRSFLKPVAQVGDAKSTLLLPNGSFAVMQPNSRDFVKVQTGLPSRIDRDKIPADLQCLLCQDLLREAVSTPCCNFVFCDECIRRALLEPPAGLAPLTCPNCRNTGVSPDALVPNKAIRERVEAFRLSLPQQALKNVAAAPPPPLAPGRSIPTVELSEEKPHQHVSLPTRPVDHDATTALTGDFDDQRGRRPGNAGGGGSGSGGFNSGGARYTRDDDAVQSLAGDGGDSAVSLTGGAPPPHTGTQAPTGPTHVPVYTPMPAPVPHPPMDRPLPKGKPTDLCYNCRTYGHFARDCPHPPGMTMKADAHAGGVVDHSAYINQMVEAAVAYYASVPRDPPLTRDDIEQYRQHSRRHYEQQMSAYTGVPTGGGASGGGRSSSRRTPSPPRRRSRSRSPSRRTPPRDHKPHDAAPERDGRRKEEERRRSSPSRDERRKEGGSSRDRERERSGSDRRERDYRREDRDHHRR